MSILLEKREGFAPRTLLTIQNGLEQITIALTKEDVLTLIAQLAIVSADTITPKDRTQIIIRK